MTWSGIWPVAPTPFHEDGGIDDDGMRRVLDLMVAQGVDGICILANYSEQFVLSDAERAHLSRLCIDHVAGRVPVIVTISHYGTGICVARAAEAKAMGAAAVMMMPPYHGALRGSADQTLAQVAAVGAVGIPIMIQDAPISGVDLPVPLLVRMAQEIEAVRLFKIECAGAADKLRALIALGGAAIEAPFDGEEGISLLADLHAGATGTMTSALIPDLVGPVVRAFSRDDPAAAAAAYARVLPVINHENRQCGLRAAKAAMMAGGVIRSDHCRAPTVPLAMPSRDLLLELLLPLDPLVLRWAD